MDTTHLRNLVRVNLGETPSNPETHLLNDEQLNVWLDAYDNDTDRATASALLTIAATEVLVSKKIRTQDLQTDGPAVSAELRALAREYQNRADSKESGAVHFAGYIDPRDTRPSEAEEHR